jgi:tetratricopeptide (TPR) repeat protein
MDENREGNRDNHVENTGELGVDNDNQPLNRTGKGYDDQNKDNGNYYQGSDKDSYGTDQYHKEIENDNPWSADSKPDMSGSDISEVYNNINFDPEEQAEEEPHIAEGRRKLRVPVWVVVFLILIVVLDIVCMAQFPKVMNDYRIYVTASDRIDESNTGQAIDDLYALAEKRSDSVPILVRTTDLSMQEGYYEVAGYVIDSYLTGKSLSDAEYNRINDYITKLNNYYASSDAVTKIFNSVNKKAVTDADYEKVKKDIKALLNQEGQDNSYLYYSLALIEADVNTAKDDMLRSYELDPECFDVRSQLAVMYRRLGNFEEAKRFAQEALKKDKKDSSALRAMATIALTEGNLEDGLNYAREAYTSYADGLYVRETYLIALTFNGNKEEAQLIQNEMADAGETPDDQTKQLLNGEITLKDYYVGE